MKLLIVSPYLPHPQSGHGTGVFMYGLLERLTRRQDVTLVSFCDRKELQLAEDLKSLPIVLHTIRREKGMQGKLLPDMLLAVIRIYQLLRSIVCWQPYYVSKWWDAAAARHIRRLTEDNRYDIVQLELAFMGPYMRYVRSGKTVLHEHDVALRPAYRRYKSKKNILHRFVLFLEWCRWNFYERKIVRRFNHVIAVTEQDQMLLQRLTGTRHISYLPRAVEAPNSVPAYQSRGPNSLLFVGTFSHAPNVDAALWLCEKIFPLVLQKIPGAILYIVGADPPPALYTLAKQTNSIKLLGFVSDIQQYFQSCRVFVAPLRLGGGVKVKILHAMAQAIPVVTTKVGIEGIEAITSDAVFVANSAQTIAGHICELLENPVLAEQVGKKGRELVKRFYSWERVVAKLETIYEQVVSERVKAE